MSTSSITAFATQGASIAGGVSVYNQTGGTVTVSPGTGNSQYVVKAVGQVHVGEDPPELLEAVLTRIDELDPQINAFVHLLPEAARASKPKGGSI